MLIPLNRSLQRHAAKPDYFAYPRAVVGVDSEPAKRPGFSGMLLKDHLTIFIHLEESMKEEPRAAGGQELSGLDALLAKEIDELDLSVRSANCLKNANIHTLRDLVRKTEKDMLETKHFGRKSLEELQELLGRLGLAFGMDVPEAPPRRSTSVIA